MIKWKMMLESTFKNSIEELEITEESRDDTHIIFYLDDQPAFRQRIKNPIFEINSDMFE